MRIARAVGLSVFVLAVVACPRPQPPAGGYRGAMRDLVIAISTYGEASAPGFIVVPQNGLELLAANADPAGPLATAYVVAIDGVSQEHPFYGQDGYDLATPASDRDDLTAWLDRAVSAGLTAMTADYCDSPAKVDDAYAQALARGYLPFVGSTGSIDLDAVPTYPAAPVGVHDGDVTALADAANFLYLINPDGFGSKAAFVATLQATNYDLLLIDAYFDGAPLQAADVAALKTKQNGGSRLVIAYMNIGSAETYRAYWQAGWRVGNPAWLAGRYAGYPDEYWVRYWDSAWAAILYGSPGAYLDGILAAGFDGVYLDNILAYEYFE